MIEWLVGAAALMAVLRSGRPEAKGLGVVERGTLTSPYGVQRTDTHVHRGVDISAPDGTPVRSLANGVVVQTTADCQRQGYGNTVLVQHDDGTLGFYAHLSRFATSTGARVARGQTIGFVGRTNCRLDRSTAMAPHLHLEVHTSTSRTPAGHYIVAENIPSRMNPEHYLASAGIPVADKKVQTEVA